MSEKGTFSFQADVSGRVFLASAGFENADIGPYANIDALPQQTVYHVTWQKCDDVSVTGSARGKQLPLQIGNAGHDNAAFCYGAQYMFTLHIYSTDTGDGGQTGWRKITQKLFRSFEPAIPDPSTVSGGGQDAITWLVPIHNEIIV